METWSLLKFLLASSNTTCFIIKYIFNIIMLILQQHLKSLYVLYRHSLNSFECSTPILGSTLMKYVTILSVRIELKQTKEVVLSCFMEGHWERSDMLKFKDGAWGRTWNKLIPQSPGPVLYTVRLVILSRFTASFTSKKQLERTKVSR